MALGFSVLAPIEGAVAQIAPRGVGVACTDPTQGAPEGEVFYSEAVAMARAVPKRRDEFFAGRHAAHQAMTRCGLPVAPVPMRADRAPEWAAGMVGSISHCDAACISVVADQERYRALAVDIEPDEALPGEVESMVCLPQERARLDRLPEAARGRAARAIFSAKECVYKLQYQITQNMLDFSDVEIVLDADDQGFAAHFAANCNPFGDTLPLRGELVREDGLIVSMMYAAQNSDFKR